MNITNKFLYNLTEAEDDALNMAWKSSAEGKRAIQLKAELDKLKGRESKIHDEIGKLKDAWVNRRGK